MRRSAWFTPRTTTSTWSPGLTTSDGLRAFFDQDISERWIRPSMPFSSSTNAPKSATRVTVPLHAVAGLVLLGHQVPRMRLKLLQAERNAPLGGIHLEHLGFDLLADGEHVGRLVRRGAQEISATCSRASTPPISTKAP